MMTIEKNETLSHGIVRILLQLLDAIHDELNNTEIPLDDRIHNARTGFKWCRALLRFVRNAIPDDDYKRENLHFRDLGRLLAESRDRYILIESIDYIIAQYPETVSKTAFQGIRKRLEQAYQQQIQHFKDGHYLNVIVQGLQEAKNRIRQWQVTGPDAAFYDGMTKVYRKAVALMAAAYTQADDNLMHEWRKQVKYLWYQVDLLIPEDPQDQQNLSTRLHGLSTLLGLDHDLLELQRVLVAMQNDEIVQEKELLLELIDREKIKLQSRAHQSGKALFNTAPEIFQQRVLKEWHQ